MRPWLAPAPSHGPFFHPGPCIIHASPREYCLAEAPWLPYAQSAEDTQGAQGTRIDFEVPDTPTACQELVHVLRDFRLDFRSIVSTALHSRPGHRDFVIRVKGEQADALARELKAKYGEAVSIHVI